MSRETWSWESELDALRDCTLCPRQCHADRVTGPPGYCRTGADIRVGAITSHRGEEPVLSGPHGICNVFFTRCNLACRYCQNVEISRREGPRHEVVLSPDEAVARVERVLDQGSTTVGFVSPSHCVPQMRAIIAGLARRGRRPTTVMNTNAYDRVETLRALEDTIDVYLPDLKYADENLARTYSDARDYPQVAAEALREMYRQKGEAFLLDEQGLLRSGLIVRHLVLPGAVENSLQCLRFIAEELSPRVHVSLLAQYSPTPAVSSHPDLGRPLREEEYEAVLRELDRLGFENGWTQELESHAHYLPDFSLEDPFEGR